MNTVAPMTPRLFDSKGENRMPRLLRVNSDPLILKGYGSGWSGENTQGTAA